MEQKEKESDNIELRSEKVRNVIGKVPPRLVSLGYKPKNNTGVCAIQVFVSF